MGVAQGTLAEMRELKTEIAGLRNEMKRFTERANQQHLDTVIADLRGNYAGLFANHQVESAKADLAARMPGDCKMQEKCYEVFLEFLQKTSQHIRDGQVSEGMVRSYREQMKAMRSKGPFERCGTCFSELNRLFEKQIDLMQSLGICKEAAGQESGTGGEPDESAVRDLLEPVANIQRFQIVKALMVRTRTFSDISHLTGLKGGNLLFHIRKLTESGMILQRHERGDYIITRKGFRTMTAIADLHRAVHEAEP